MPSEGLEPTATVTCTVTKTNGGILSATMSVMFYQPDAKFGDYVYHDGTYSSILNTQKTVVGIVLDVDETGKHGQCCSLNVSKKDGGLVEAPSKIYYTSSPYITMDKTIDGAINSLKDSTADVMLDFLTEDDGSIKLFTVGNLSNNDINNTNIIIDMAKERVTSLDRLYPSSLEEYEQYVNDYPTDYSNVAPLALLSKFYEPIIENNQILNDKFKIGNWNVIDVRLLVRLFILIIKNFDCIKNNILLVPSATDIVSLSFCEQYLGQEYIRSVYYSGTKYSINNTQQFRTTTPGKTYYVCKF
ncbi:MAG: hypothetical protein IJ341_10005 [Bacteroidales bacterium]|nr:hypothetical protein [Bacteroidales bacterium]MBQ7820014.1 hypothetical protein [Bacteroidales bacterium]